MAVTLVGSVADALHFADFRIRLAKGMVSESSAESEKRIRLSSESGVGDLFFFPFPRGFLDLGGVVPPATFFPNGFRARAFSGRAGLTTGT